MINLIFIGGAALLSVISMPIIINFCKKFSLYDSQNARKIHSGNIPRLGGVGIAISFFVMALLCVIFEKNIDMFSNLPLLIAAFIIFIIFVIISYTLFLATTAMATITNTATTYKTGLYPVYNNFVSSFVVSFLVSVFVVFVVFSFTSSFHFFCFVVC